MQRSFIIMEPTTNNNSTNEPEAPEFEARVQATQHRRAAELQSSYDFIVCGSGSSGSVVTRRLAEAGDVSVLLLEAGGTDDLPSVRDAGQCLANVGTQLDWGFQTAPNRLLNGRRLSLCAGKVLGGSSSFNAMIWSRTLICSSRNLWSVAA
jgi:choline dehydrogenase